MVVDVTDQAVKDYQTTRLREKASAKSINEEVGFLIRALGEQGDYLRAKLRRQKTLKLRVTSRVAQAFTADEKNLLLAEAKTRRSRAIYPATHAGPKCRRPRYRTSGVARGTPRSA